MKKSEQDINLQLVRVTSRYIHSLFSPMVKHVREHGLTDSQFHVLEVLYAKGPQSITSLVERSLSTEGNIGLVVKNLVKLQLVEKDVDPDDRRARLISLTKKGDLLISAYFPKHVEALNELLSKVPREEKEALIEQLKKVGRVL